MEDYKREYPLFSLCGLNCGLCPRYQTKGESKCPGCGGKDFRLKHPACSVFTCNRKHDAVEFCFQCSSYPCEKYSQQSSHDSFISYINVVADFEKANQYGLDQYKAELNEKMNILDYLINHFDDGRRKAYYCNAVNLLSLKDLRDIEREIKKNINQNNIALKEVIAEIIILFETKANEAGIILSLRK
jgi:hypothetical protein